MNAVEPLYTAAQLAEAQAYHAPIYTEALVDLILSPVLVGGAALFLTRPLHALASRWGLRARVPALDRFWKSPDWARRRSSSRCCTSASSRW